MLAPALARRCSFSLRHVLPARLLSSFAVSENLARTYESKKISRQFSTEIDPKQQETLKKLDDNVLPETSVKPHDEQSFAAAYIPGRGIHVPFLHPRTHSVPVAALHFRSHHTDLLELYTHFVSHAATALGIPISRVIKLPTQRTLWTVPKSPFVHKKSQENFERRVHKRMIKAWDADQDVVDLWLQYLQKHSIGGVGIKIVRWERVPVGVGRMRIEGVAEQWNPRAELRLELEGLAEHMNAREEIMELGQRIVDEEEDS